MQCGEERVTASPTEAIYDWNGQRTAMELFEEKNIISKDLFYHIYWEGLGKVMKTRFNLEVMARLRTRSHTSLAGCRAHPADLDGSLQQHGLACVP